MNIAGLHRYGWLVNTKDMWIDWGSNPVTKNNNYGNIVLVSG